MPEEKLTYNGLVWNIHKSTEFGNLKLYQE